MKIILFCVSAWMSFCLALGCFSSGSKTPQVSTPPTDIGEKTTEQTPKSKKNGMYENSNCCSWLVGLLKLSLTIISKFAS